MAGKFNIHLLIFGLAILLFNWPLLSIPMQNNPVDSFIYLFLSWAIIIFFLMLFRKTNTDTEKKENMEKEGENDV